MQDSLICDDLMDVDPEMYKWEKPEEHIQKENRTWRYSTLFNVNELKKWDGERGETVLPLL